MADGSYHRVPPSVRLRNPIFLPASAGLDPERPKIHPLEKALIGLTALNLCFLPWALGTMQVWSQLTSLALSLAGFVLALLPRREPDGFSSAPQTTSWAWIRLKQFPIFWASLALLTYLVVQGVNPAWHYVRDGNEWWLEPVDHLTWLPSGMDAPFAISNPWRLFTVLFSLSLLVCTVWTGFLRRQSYRILFLLLSVNGGLLGLLGLFQRIDGTDLIYWSYLPSNTAFIASFIYPNHAGPYFNLIVSVAVGLAWWQYERYRHRLAGTVPATLLTILAAAIGLVVIFSYSRASITLLLVFMVLIAGILAVRLLRRKKPFFTSVEFLPLVVVLAGLASFCLVAINTDKVWSRFAGLLADPVATARNRTLTRQAAFHMLQDRWVFGWGGGCFRYGFSKYAKAYPEINLTADGRHLAWEHAHNDLLEFPIDLGVVGCLPLVVIFGYLAWQLGRRKFWRNSVSVSLVVGCSLVFVHAWVDFVFQNPAVLLTWSVLLIGALRWTELDQPGGRKMATPYESAGTPANQRS